MLRHSLLAAAVAGLAATATPAAAQFSVFTDEGSFQSALGSYSTEGFESFTTQPAPIVFPVQGGTAAIKKGEIVDGSQPFDKDPVNGNRAYAFYPSIHGTSPAQIFFQQAMSGFGTYLRDLDVTPPSISFYMNNVFVDSYSVPTTGNGGTTYRGYKADPGVTFDRIDLGQASSDWITYDDMTFSVAGQTVVPEPGTVILLGTGLLGLGIVGRRRLAGAEDDGEAEGA